MRSPGERWALGEPHGSFLGRPASSASHPSRVTVALHSAGPHEQPHSARHNPFSRVPCPGKGGDALIQYIKSIYVSDKLSIMRRLSLSKTCKETSHLRRIRGRCAEFRQKFQGILVFLSETAPPTNHARPFLGARIHII